MTERKRTIVGIDPGATSAIAVLDLKGNTRKVESEKHMGTKGIVRKISESGKPVLVATDKEKLPSAVEEVASSFGAEVFTPEEDLSVHGKKELTRKHDYENLHERDAMAAALNAYNSLKNKFRNIEARMDDLNLQDLTPEVKEAVVTNEAKNVSEAVEMVLGNDEEEEDSDEEIKRDVDVDLEEKIDNYRQMLIEERKDKEKLKEHNEKLKEEIKDLKDKLSDVRKEKKEAEKDARKEALKDEKVKKLKRNLRSKENRVRSLQNEKDNLESEVERLITFEVMRKEGKIPLRTVDMLDEETINKEDSRLSLRQSAVLANEVKETEETIELLSEKGVKIVVGDISEEFKDRFFEEGLLACDTEEIEIEERNDVKYLKQEDLEEIRREDKESLMGWLNRYRSTKNGK